MSEVTIMDVPHTCSWRRISLCLHWNVNGESLHVKIQEHLSSCFSFQLTTDLWRLAAY